jgi:hypothetical protein
MHFGKHTKSHLVTYNRKRSLASKLQMQGRYEIQMPHAKTARSINLCTYWLGYDRGLTADEWAVFPTDLVRLTTRVTHLTPALPHEKDCHILSGVQEGLKTWIRYHIERGPWLKRSNMYVRAAGELILEARHRICRATLPAVLNSRDRRSILRSFSISGYDKVILFCYSMDTCSIN